MLLFVLLSTLLLTTHTAAPPKSTCNFCYAINSRIAAHYRAPHERLKLGSRLDTALRFKESRYVASELAVIEFLERVCSDIDDIPLVDGRIVGAGGEVGVRDRKVDDEIRRRAGTKLKTNLSKRLLRCQALLEDWEEELTPLMLTLGAAVADGREGETDGFPASACGAAGLGVCSADELAAEAAAAAAAATDAATDDASPDVKGDL
jgi:hypothetical protein